MSLVEVKQYEPLRWYRAPRVSESGYLFDEIGGGFVAVGNAPNARGLIFTKQRTLMAALREIAKAGAVAYVAGTARSEADRALREYGAGVLAIELESLARALGE